MDTYPMLQGPYTAAECRTSHPERPSNLLVGIATWEMWVQIYSGRERDGGHAPQALAERLNHRNIRMQLLGGSSDFVCVLWDAFLLRP